MPESTEKSTKKDLPEIVRRVPDPSVPNRAHTEMKQRDDAAKKDVHAD